MIALNKENGDLRVDNLMFGSGTSPENILNLDKTYEIKNSTRNKDYPIYILKNLENRNANLMFMFQNNKLSWIAIGLMEAEKPFEITDKDKINIRNRIGQIGGEQIYDWGTVSIVEDHKAGDISIKILYNS